MEKIMTIFIANSFAAADVASLISSLKAELPTLKANSNFAATDNVVENEETDEDSATDFSQTSQNNETLSTAQNLISKLYSDLNIKKSTSTQQTATEETETAQNGTATTATTNEDET